MTCAYETDKFECEACVVGDLAKMADQILELSTGSRADLDLSMGWMIELPFTKTCVRCPATKIGRFTVVELPPYFSVYPTPEASMTQASTPQASIAAITPSQAAAVPLPASSDDYDTDTSCDSSAPPQPKLFSIFSMKPTPMKPSMNRASKPRFKSRKLQARMDRTSHGPNLQKQACIRQFLARQCDGPIRDEQA